MVSAVQKSSHTFLDEAKGVAHSIIRGGSQLKKDLNASYSGMRWFMYLFTGTGHALNKPSNSNAVVQNFSTAIGVVDTFQVLADVDYFVNKRYKDDKPLTIAGKVGFAFANVAGAALWFAKLGFFTLGKVALTVGGSLVTGFAGVGWSLMAADAIKRQVQAVNKEQKIKSAMDIAVAVSEVALAALGIAATFLASPAGMAVVLGLGLVATSVGMASYLYGLGNKEALAATKKSSSLPEQGATAAA